MLRHFMAASVKNTCKSNMLRHFIMMLRALRASAFNLRLFSDAKCPPGTSSITVLGRSPIVSGLVGLSSIVMVGWLCAVLLRVIHDRKAKRSDAAHELLPCPNDRSTNPAAQPRPPTHRRGASAELMSEIGGELRRDMSRASLALAGVASVDEPLMQSSTSRMQTSVGVRTLGRLGLRRNSLDERSDRMAGVLAATPPAEGTDVPAPTTARKMPVTIEFDDLRLTLKPPLPKKTILAGVTGALRSGRLTAIMGPSGAGKTSFLNVVSGKAASYGDTTGTLRINGVAEKTGIQPYKLAVGFVPQEDTMLREMTAKEIFFFAARMRLPPGTSTDVIRKRVVETLDRLNLWQIRHVQVGVSAAPSCCVTTAASECGGGWVAISGRGDARDLWWAAEAREHRCVHSAVWSVFQNAGHLNRHCVDQCVDQAWSSSQSRQCSSCEFSRRFALHSCFALSSIGILVPHLGLKCPCTGSDEPTSGLDATSSLEVCRALRGLADEGITVAAVLHQPRYEIFEMFHDVLLV